MGLRTSVTGVASSLIGLLRTRLELLALEAAEEKTRLVKVLGMAFAALLFVTLAVLVFTVMVAVAFWPTENRYMALGVLAAVYAVLGIGLLLALRRQLLFGPVPFAATIEELGRDADLLARVRAAREEGDEDSDDASDEDVAHSAQSARARRVAAARQVGS
ncbi:phage holin family protein [Bordetella sp. 15P40C-2]|uniref:phage holin family protein n=1 Tax=Bordetella sp. 15P40C-2 TaxID=2572246 RepID=UPI00132122DE|nr:phage holin family protein [Bordetella sp. 15P40C-2]MVW70853.1 phage holin family protein [Bordetella sp. 15P40C-2]